MNEETIAMPKELTSENGMKYLLIGEFFEEVEVHCPECDGAGFKCDYAQRDAYMCETCDGAGEYLQKVPIQWTTIKEIYKKIVEHVEGRG